MAATITQTVINHYSSLAREDSATNGAHAKKVAEAFGYSPEDLESIPEGANLGLSCGNPLATASLREGEIVLDLGSGAGFDVFQAARKIGVSGLAIGVDMSADMLALARQNATKASITNVKFIKAPIISVPLESSSVDCIISNCVINLLPPDDKKVCFREILRLLKPGGRLAISDTLARRPISEELQRNMGMYVGCISGANLVTEYDTWLREVGFEDIMIVDKNLDLNIYKERKGSQLAASCCVVTVKDASCCAPAPSCCSTEGKSNTGEKVEQEGVKVADLDFNDWVGSYAVYAVKALRA